MALSDAHWSKIMKAIQFLGDQRQPGDHLLIFRENWDLLSDESKLDAFIKAKTIEQMEAQVATQEESLAAQKAELTKLKER
jgi:hypothetical protein